MTIDEIERFRQLHSKTPGHPENFMTAGVETTTGPLGQGIATSVGMALAERMLAAEFGDDIVDHRTYVLCSDGDLMEGISHEAIALAGHLKLNKLIFLFDDNGISIDGPLTLADSVDQVARFKAAGWNAMRIDGQDPNAIAGAIETALSADRPTLIACKTTIGFGAPTKAGTSKAHGEPLGADEIAGARKNLDWDSPAVRRSPTTSSPTGAPPAPRRRAARRPGRSALPRLDADKRAEFERRMARKLPAGARRGHRRPTRTSSPPRSRRSPPARRASWRSRRSRVAMPELILGSADLTPSNNTKTKDLDRHQAGRLRRPLHPLRHPRARHGRRP